GPRLWRRLGDRWASGNRALLAFDQSAVDQHGPAHCPGVARDASALVNADVAVQRDDVALHGSVDIEVAVRDGDRTVDGGVGGDRTIAVSEVVGVRQVLV